MLARLTRVSYTGRDQLHSVGKRSLTLSRQERQGANAIDRFKNDVCVVGKSFLKENGFGQFDVIYARQCSTNWRRKTLCELCDFARGLFLPNGHANCGRRLSIVLHGKCASQRILPSLATGHSLPATLYYVVALRFSVHFIRNNKTGLATNIEL